MEKSQQVAVFLMETEKDDLYSLEKSQQVVVFLMETEKDDLYSLETSQQVVVFRQRTCHCRLLSYYGVSLWH